jgi:thioredoxin 1
MSYISKSEFENVVNKGVVLVDFAADWCGPCKMLNPILEDLKVQLEGKVNIVSINVDTEQELAMKFNVMSIPTLILFNEGQMVGQVVGFQSKAMLEKFIAKAYSN